MIQPVKAAKQFGKVFWTAWLVKVVGPALIRRLKGKPVDGMALLDKQACGSAAILAAFFALLQQLNNAGLEPGYAAFLSSILFYLENRESRQAWAGYLAVRAGMALLRGKLHANLYKSIIHVIYTISITQLMYGVVVRPDGGEGLAKWLAMAGLMPGKPVMDNVRGEIELEGGCDTCRHLHPGQPCVTRILSVYGQVFKVIFPLNLGLAILGNLNRQLKVYLFCFGFY